MVRERSCLLGGVPLQTPLGRGVGGVTRTNPVNLESEFDLAAVCRHLDLLMDAPEFNSGCHGRSQ